MDALFHAALNNAAWAAALAVAAAIGARIWRRRPAVAHVLWLMVLLKLVTPSLIQFSLPRDNMSRVPSTQGVDADSRPSLPAASSPIEIPAAPSNSGIAGSTEAVFEQGQGGRLEVVTRESTTPVARPSMPWWNTIRTPGYLVVPWLAGAAAWWLVVGIACARFRRLIRSARPAPPELVERLRQVAAKLGLGRVPMAWLLPARVPPMLWVPLAGSPRLVLPEELWGQLDPAQQEAVLAHELAHLKRRDHWVRRLEAAVLGLYWWDPVAWWARRELERAEEECCDAWVVWALPAATGAYAEALVATTEYLSGLRRPLPLAASGAGSLVSLKRRLSMIISHPMSVSVARTSPRMLLVLGVLLLPILPGLALGHPPGESAGASVAESLLPEQAAPSAIPPSQDSRKPKSAPAQQLQDGNEPKAENKVRVIQPISREVGEFIDIPEVASLASDRVELSARVSGRIDRVNCRPFQAVKKGALLFEIDSSSQKLMLEKAEAEVRQAQARRKSRELELRQAKSLKERFSVSQQEVNRIESEYEEAEANLQSVQADRDLARLNLEATKVISPIDGVVSRVMMTVGKAVIANSTELAVVLALDPLHVDLYISENTARFLDRSTGGRLMKSGVDLELPVLIGVRDEVGYAHRGRIEFVDPEVQPVSETAIRCRATIPNPDRSLSPGMKARIRLVANARHKALLIPEMSLVGEPNGSRGMVSVVNDRNSIEDRIVGLGMIYDGLREVEDGLKADEWVVTNRMPIQPGQKVVVERVNPSSGATSNRNR